MENSPVGPGAYDGCERGFPAKRPETGGEGLGDLALRHPRLDEAQRIFETGGRGCDCLFDQRHLGG